ncbi:primary repressor of lytic functions [Escherichia coli]|nr:primary repressor of lytic functions [Escherichia coli]
MINYVYGEQLYQEFVSFRDLFLKKAVARAQHVDAASDGRPVRPVVVLPFKETDSIQAEIDKWTLMARELEQYPDLNIPKTIYIQCLTSFAVCVRLRLIRQKL